ncbi:MAG: hypothetical protein F6K30_24660, partial [Cyanothece sp. SIO2G6]|nr:hypothetical protein [Cyanothece sp. SIO2G6]
MFCSFKGDRLSSCMKALWAKPFGYFLTLCFSVSISILLLPNITGMGCAVALTLPTAWPAEGMSVHAVTADAYWAVLDSPYRNRDRPSADGIGKVYM